MKDLFLILIPSILLIIVCYYSVRTTLTSSKLQITPTFFQRENVVTYSLYILTALATACIYFMYKYYNIAYFENTHNLDILNENLSSLYNIRKLYS